MTIILAITPNSQLEMKNVNQLLRFKFQALSDGILGTYFEACLLL
jgi:hypothetical protein